jgi:hypothetical protein
VDELLRIAQSLDEAFHDSLSEYLSDEFLDSMYSKSGDHPNVEFISDEAFNSLKNSLIESLASLSSKIAAEKMPKDFDASPKNDRQNEEKFPFDDSESFESSRSFELGVSIVDSLRQKVDSHLLLITEQLLHEYLSEIDQSTIDESLKMPAENPYEIKDSRSVSTKLEGDSEIFGMNSQIMFGSITQSTANG